MYFINGWNGAIKLMKWLIHQSIDDVRLSSTMHERCHLYASNKWFGFFFFVQFSCARYLIYLWSLVSLTAVIGADRWNRKCNFDFNWNWWRSVWVQRDGCQLLWLLIRALRLKMNHDLSSLDISENRCKSMSDKMMKWCFRSKLCMCVCVKVLRLTTFIPRRNSLCKIVTFSPSLLEWWLAFFAVNRKTPKSWIYSTASVNVTTAYGKERRPPF